jgi:hypothetical protein
MFDAKPLQTGFVLLQSAYGFIAFHSGIIARGVSQAKRAHHLHPPKMVGTAQMRLCPPLRR